MSNGLGPSVDSPPLTSSLTSFVQLLRVDRARRRVDGRAPFSHRSGPVCALAPCTRRLGPDAAFGVPFGLPFVSTIAPAAIPPRSIPPEESDHR